MTHHAGSYRTFPTNVSLFEQSNIYVRTFTFPHRDSTLGFACGFFSLLKLLRIGFPSSCWPEF